MFCEQCLRREATVFLTQITNGEMMKKNLCEECFESTEPEFAGRAARDLAEECHCCGHKGEGRWCRSCLVERQRFMKEKGYSDSIDGEITRERRAELSRIALELETHMRQWGAEQRALRGLKERLDEDESDGLGAFPGDAIFDHLATSDRRFTSDAYRFVSRAVSLALADATGDHQGHVSAIAVAEAFRRLVLKELAANALPTLKQWGIESTDDIGTLIYRMIDFGVLGRRPEDSREDFHALYDFAAVFPVI